jgi:hypothetical protein
MHVSLDGARLFFDVEGFAIFRNPIGISVLTGRAENAA